MISKYENVYYNEKVGDITLDKNLLIFETNKKSINSEEIKIEIPIADIDKKKLFSKIKTNKLSIVEIETSGNKYVFEFGFCDVYDNFINRLYKIIS